MKKLIKNLVAWLIIVLGLIVAVVAFNVTGETLKLTEAILGIIIFLLGLLLVGLKVAGEK